MERIEIYFILSFLISFLILNIFRISINLQIIIYTLLFVPFIYYKIREYLEEEEAEYNFPVFLRDLGYYLEIGQPLPIALKSVKENDYGKKLNYEIRKMITEMEFGLTFIEAFERMARRMKSDKIKKTIYSIIEAEKYGGDIKGLFQYLSQSLDDLMQIKKERISRIKNFMLIYYGIFFGLLISIISIIYFVKGFLKIKIPIEILETFKNTGFLLILLNAIFTGLVIGKVSTGKVISGVIHSVILVIISSLVYSLI